MSKSILGHKIQRERLKKLLKLNKFSAPLLFVGEEGIGKQLVAKELFQSLICEQLDQYGGCNTCQSCKLFTTKNYPDYYEIEAKDKESSNTQNIRKLLSTIQLNSFQGSWKLILINDIDELNLTVLNALLKSLEEPQEKTLWCLISKNYTRLPKTITSRCQLWFFDSLKHSEINLYLREQKEIEDQTELQKLSLLLNGSLSNYETIKEQNEEWSTVVKSAERIFSGDSTTAIKLSEALKKDKEKAVLYSKLFSVYARIKMKESESNADKHRWAIMLKSCTQAEDLLMRRNLNAGFVFQNILLSLSKNSHRRSNLSAVEQL